jgi:hypothetical protein
MKLKALVCAASICMVLGCEESKESTTITNKLPLFGDEISVAELKAFPRKYLGVPVVILGGLKTENYYNYGYNDADITHFSLGFLESTEDAKSNGERLTVYGRRDMAEPLVARILQKQKQGGYKGVRLKIEITGRSFSRGGAFNENAELLGWQFLHPTENKWEDWQPPPPKIERLTPADIATREAREEKTRQEYKARIKAQLEAKQQATKARVLKWHEELAAKGNDFGQFKMGERYLVGDGVEKDETKARNLFSKSAAQGNEDAVRALEKLKAR